MLGILDVIRGRLDEAKGLLSEALSPEPGIPQHPVRDPHPGRLCPAGAR